ncbi:MAG: hypothetical protein AB8G23_21000 [Myxococcota bacterium]
MSRLIGFVMALPLLAVAILFGASELGGEVVVLETMGSRGEKFSTSLWVVDIDDSPVLRSGDANSEWLIRLQLEPLVTLIRDDVRIPYRAEVIPGYAAPVNAAMREKYGIADQVVGLIHEGDEVIGIRLLER